MVRFKVNRTRLAHGLSGRTQSYETSAYSHTLTGAAGPVLKDWEIGLMIYTYRPISTHPIITPLLPSN